jgi:signal peptidase I
VTDARPEPLVGGSDDTTAGSQARTSTAVASSGNGSSAGSAPGPPRPGTPGGRARPSRTVVEWGVLVVAALVIAVLIRAFLFQAFYIPSESMYPTLKVNDRVLVNKLSYDLHDVHRGDIVVFEAEPNNDWKNAGIRDLVKRVVALPGETIRQCNGVHVCIDGRQLDEDYLPAGTPTTFEGGTPPGCRAGSPPDGCTVPAGQVFVMGDNRVDSADARTHGPVKVSSIVGRVFVRMWPVPRFAFM